MPVSSSFALVAPLRWMQSFSPKCSSKAAKLDEMYRVQLPDPDLAFLPIGEQEGHDYFRDMLFALRYAAENRRRMMAVLKETFAEFVPETAFLREVNIHHNYAAFEEHFGEKLCIHRKGALRYYEALADYLHNVLGGTTGRSYAKPQGRIKIIED